MTAVETYEQKYMFTSTNVEETPNSEVTEAVAVKTNETTGQMSSYHCWFLTYDILGPNNLAF